MRHHVSLQLRHEVHHDHHHEYHRGVPPGEAPPLQPGFAGLYRALGLPVVPIAQDSGKLWPRSGPKRSGTIHFKVGEIILEPLRVLRIEEDHQARLRELASPGIVPESLRKYLQAEVQRRTSAREKSARREDTAGPSAASNED